MVSKYTDSTLGVQPVHVGFYTNALNKSDELNG